MWISLACPPYARRSGMCELGALDRSSPSLPIG